MRALSYGRDIFRCHWSCAVPNRPTQYILVLTLAYKIRTSSGAVSRVADSEAGLCWFETGGSTYIFFLQIIYLHLSPLLLICISKVFDVSRVSSRGSFTYKILSMKQLTHILNISHFQCF